MGTVNVTLGDGEKLNLILGQQLENAVTAVVFDFSAWKTEFGSGTLGLSVQRHGDDQPYAVVPTVSGNNATWNITELDTAYKGVGEVQVTYTVGSVVKKSTVYKFTVYRSLGENGEYPSPGQTWQEEIEDELADVKQDLSENIAINFVSKNTIIVSNLEDGFYNTVNGNKYDNSGGSTYRRSPYLVRVEEKKLYVSNTANLRACCYDKDGSLITSMYLYTKDSLKTTKPIVTPANTYFLGLFANGWPTSFSLTKYDSADTQFVEYPFQSDEYLYFEKTWTNSGTMGATENLDCVVMPNLQAGSKYYVSNNATNCICLKWDGTTVAATKETLLDSWGAIYTIPADTALTFWNFYRVRTKGVNNESTEYIAKITKGKVLAIGDSITWLEGKENYGGMAVVSGWQRQLRLAGYDVRNAGWSGHPYANGLDIVDGVDYSIYKDIVSGSYVVGGYDYIILFGGTNDVLYNGTLGNRPTDYSNRTFDPSTFNGAVGGIINYIRTNNTTAKILLASFPKSEAVSRSYINASSRVEELKYNADFWSCKYVNIFDDMNVQPTYDGFDLYFYDVTHPNYNGMQLIGKLMRKAIEIYE